MAVVAAVTSRSGVVRILEGLGLPTTRPGFHSARPPPQTQLPFEATAFEADPPVPDGFDS